MVPGWPLRWLLIPRSIRKSPAPDLCGSWNSAERFYPDICWHPRVSSPTFPIWVVSLQTPRFCFHGSWLVLSEQGWVRGEEVWQLGLLLGFGVITGRKVQNKGGCKQESGFSVAQNMVQGQLPSLLQGSCESGTETPWKLCQVLARSC